MDVVIELRSRERPGVEGYRVDLIIFSHNGKNNSKSIVWGIGFHNKLCIRNPMRKNRSKDEDLLQSIEWYPIFVVKIPRSIFSGKTSEQNDYVWIIENQTSIEVGES